jgi:heme-degrading monooxygenase HmoA
MAFGIIHRFKGGTAEQYDNLAKAVHPDGGKGMPKGTVLRIAGTTKDGFVVVALWDSQQAFEDFRDNVLGPAFTTVENGLPGPPDETTFEVHEQV